MSPRAKSFLVGTLAVLTTAGAVAWIYWREFKAPHFDVELHRIVGQVMAEQTAAVVGKSGKIVVITIPTSGEPELQVELKAFYDELKKLGDFQVRDYEMDTKDQDKYGVGMGLSGRRYVRTVNKNLDAAAVVSFIGAPSLKAKDIAELQKVPKLIAQARSVDDLPPLFNKGLIAVAVSSRFTFPAPGPIQPKTARERFDKRYQLVVAKNVHTVPGTE